MEEYLIPRSKSLSNSKTFFDLEGSLFFSTYLQNQQQRVCWHTTFSEVKKNKFWSSTGISSWTHFLKLYINDVYNHLIHNVCILYAHHSPLIRIQKQMDKLTDEMSQPKKKPDLWFKQNKCKLNKTQRSSNTESSSYTRLRGQQYQIT